MQSLLQGKFGSQYDKFRSTAKRQPRSSTCYILKLSKPKPPTRPTDVSKMALNDKLREKCGILGISIWGTESATACTCHCLRHLQNHGQEGAETVVKSIGKDNTDKSGEVIEREGLGLVGNAFEKAGSRSLKGETAIGQVSYSTAGSGHIRNAQPFCTHTKDVEVAIAHNGNLTNARGLRTELEMRRSALATSSDAKVSWHLIATSASSRRGLERRVGDAFEKL